MAVAFLRKERKKANWTQLRETVRKGNNEKKWKVLRNRL